MGYRRTARVCTCTYLFSIAPEMRPVIPAGGSTAGVWTTCSLTTGGRLSDMAMAVSPCGMVAGCPVRGEEENVVVMSQDGSGGSKSRMTLSLPFPSLIRSPPAPPLALPGRRTPPTQYGRPPRTRTSTRKTGRPSPSTRRRARHGSSITADPSVVPVLGRDSTRRAETGFGECRDACLAGGEAEGAAGGVAEWGSSGDGNNGGTIVT